MPLASSSLSAATGKVSETPETDLLAVTALGPSITLGPDGAKGVANGEAGAGASGAFVGPLAGAVAGAPETPPGLFVFIGHIDP